MGFELESDMKDVKIHPEPVTLPMFLGEQKCRELLECIAQAEREHKTVYLGSWDAGTGFAVGVIIDDGKPHRWSVLGPMGKEEAREYLGMQKLSFVPRGAAPVH